MFIFILENCNTSLVRGMFTNICAGVNHLNARSVLLVRCRTAEDMFYIIDKTVFL